MTLVGTGYRHYFDLMEWRMGELNCERQVVNSGYEQLGQFGNCNVKTVRSNMPLWLDHQAGITIQCMLYSACDRYIKDVRPIAWYIKSDRPTKFLDCLVRRYCIVKSKALREVNSGNLAPTERESTRRWFRRQCFFSDQSTQNQMLDSRSIKARVELTWIPMPSHWVLLQLAYLLCGISCFAP